MKIGYTTGVFDLFHIGHLNILKNAKENCDYLIVGVTTDEEVKRVKNRETIIPFEERIEIIDGLKYVDRAVPEDDVDKLKAWTEYRYDRIFKGDDWKDSPQWDEYEREFSQRGVEVVYFPYTKGTSSTHLRNVLKEFLNTKSK